MIDIPELDPLDATVKEGLITVTADAAAKVAVMDLKTPLAPPATFGPWSPAIPMLAIPWRANRLRVKFAGRRAHPCSTRKSNKK